MIYSFISDEDLRVSMQQYFIDQLTSDASNVLTIAEGAVFSMIKAKLNNRYDLALLFPKIVNWSATTSYLVGQYSYKNGKIFKSTQAGTNQDPEAPSSAYWGQEDPRDPLLIVMAAQMTIFTVFKRNNPSRITDQMESDYASAIEWLEDVKELKESPDWPTLSTGTENIPWGSNPQQQHYY